MKCGVYTRGPGRGRGWRMGDGLFDAVCGRSCVLLKGHSFWAVCDETAAATTESAVMGKERGGDEEDER